MSDLFNYSDASWHQPSTFYLSLKAIDHTSAMPRELSIFTLSGLPLLIALGIGLILFLTALIFAASVVFNGLKYWVDLFLFLIRNFRQTPTPALIELPAVRVQDRTDCSGHHPTPEPIELPAVREQNRSECSRRHPAPEPIELSTEGAQNCSDNLRQDCAPSPFDAPTESEWGCSDVSSQDHVPEPTQPQEESLVDLLTESDEDWSGISSQESTPKPREPKQGPQTPYPMTCILRVLRGKTFRVRGMVYPTDGRATIFKTKRSDFLIVSFPGGKGFPELEAGPGGSFDMECQFIPQGRKRYTICGIVAPMTDRSILEFESLSGDRWIIGECEEDRDGRKGRRGR